MNALIQSQNLSPSSEVLDSLWIPSSSSSGFHGQKSMPNYNNVDATSRGGGAFRLLDKDEDIDDDIDRSYESPPAKKRRLTATQVQHLETNFEIENKLEPERKIRIAKELGLHPRQVAIWFQNRRARFKNKQLEKDYDYLKSGYCKLKFDYEVVLKEKQCLENQIEKLKEKLVNEEKGNEGFEFVRIGAMDSSNSGLQEGNFDSGNERCANFGLMVCRQEEVNSGKSVVFDSGSPTYRDGGDGNRSLITEAADSSNVFEPELSEDDPLFWLSFN